MESYTEKFLVCADCDAKLSGPYGTPGVSMARTRPNTLLCSACGTKEALSPKQKVSEWLASCGSHEIYPLKAIAADFEKQTGQKFPEFVHKHTLKETQEQMRARGLGGTLEPTKERVVWGYVMASDFAKHLAHFTSNKSGRGRVFYESIEALSKAGL